MTIVRDGLGIKTATGRRIYYRACELSDRIQIERSKHKSGSPEWERLTRNDLEVQSKGLAEALALNPKPKKRRTAKLRLR